MHDHTIWCSVIDFYQSSKNTVWRERVKQKQNILFRVLKENNLVLIDVLDSTGEAITDLELRNSNMTPEGIKLFEKTVATWMKARDKDGDYANTGILSKGLERIRAGK